MSSNALFQGTAPRDGGFQMPGYWVWCGSPIRDQSGKYHLFASRWPKDVPFHPGWLVQSEVVRAVADRPEGPYAFANVVLPQRGAEFWDGRMTHNPAVLAVEDGYALFYTGSTHPFAEPEHPERLDCSDPRVIVARSNKRIGVATAPTLEGPWTRRDQPILPVVPGSFYSFLTSNAAPCLCPDGRILMVFKARAYAGNEHGPMSIGVATADHCDGPFQVMDDRPVISESAGVELEDPCLWRQDDCYHLIAKDMTGELCGQAGAGVHAQSADGLTWDWQRGQMAYSRTLRWDDGTEQTMGSFERPALLMENGRPTHLFAAVADGPGGFVHASNTWNLAIPLDH